MRRPPRLLLFLVPAVAVGYWSAPARHAAFAVLRFPLTVLATVARVVVLLPHVPSLARDNARLRAELTRRQLETTQWREQLRLSRSRQALMDRLSGSGIPAAVIARSLLPVPQTVLIDRGARDGVTVERGVVDASGVVGRVIEVHASSSLLLLLTDPESRLGALIERTRDTGLLMGQGDGRCRLIYLELQADVQAGDRVVTAGLDGVMPKGLFLGLVQRVERDEGAGTASAWVAPASNLGRLEDVLCLSPGHQEQLAAPVPAASSPASAATLTLDP